MKTQDIRKDLRQFLMRLLLPRILDALHPKAYVAREFAGSSVKNEKYASLAGVRRRFDAQSLDPFLP
jgi:hypothetical protein